MIIKLYNHYHIGDLLFNQPIIRNLCKNNPHHTFILYCNYNSYLFKDITNLTVDTTGNFPNNHNIFFNIIDNDTISINLWIAALAINQPITNMGLQDIECNIGNYIIALKRMLEFFKNNFNIIINLEDYDEYSDLPIIPDTDISEFIQWNSNRTNNNKLVFYYNYNPKSNQSVPINDHNTFIIEIAQSFTNNIFILPSFTDEIKADIIKYSINNIISCEEKFNCKQNSITCEHLCKIQKIIELCDYSIHFDVGACMYYINNKITNSKNIPIHIATSNTYPTYLSNNSIRIKNKIKRIISNNIIDIYFQLDTILGS
jgi:hypothetical protein